MSLALFCSDIEGTLAHKNVVNPRTSELLGNIKREYFLSYVTGMRLHSFRRKYMEELHLPPPHLLAVENGALIYHVSPDYTLSEDLEWRKMVMGENGASYNLFRERVSYFPPEIRELIEWKEIMGIIPKSKLSEKGMESILSGTPDDPVTITSNNGVVELNPSTAGKHNVAKYLRQRYGLPILGAGDGHNDARFLGEIDYPMTFYDAHPDAVAIVQRSINMSGEGFITPFAGHQGTEDILLKVVAKGTL